MNRIILFIPSIICFLLPVLIISYRQNKAAAAEREKEEQRRRAAERNRYEQARKKAEKERAAAMLQAEKEKAAKIPKRKPGRPRKNPPAQRAETILKPAAPAGQLPTSCSPEQFAAWL